MRPGFLGEIGDYIYGEAQMASSYVGLAGFGKGFVAPPPSAPPGPGNYRDGRWECPGNQPTSDATHYYACCPSGWVKAEHGNTQPCPAEDRDQKECGPRPPGDVVCCPSMASWVQATPGGGDPCPGSREMNMPIPTAAEILSEPLRVDLQDDSLLSPGLVMAIGGATIVGIGITIVLAAQKKKAARAAAAARRKRRRKKRSK